LPATFGSDMMSTGAMPDVRVLNSIADEMDVHLGLPGVTAAKRELDNLGHWSGQRPVAPWVRPRELPKPVKGQAVLASWRLLLDTGRLQDGDPFLAGTAHPPRVRLSPATAEEIGAADGDEVTVSTDRGRIALPLAVTDMPDRVVWVPANSPGSAVRRQLGPAATQDAGTLVWIARSEAQQETGPDGGAE